MGIIWDGHVNNIALVGLWPKSKLTIWGILQSSQNVLQ